MEMIKSDVHCPSCGSQLCNFCAFNGMCQDCKTTIPRAVKRALDADLKTKVEEATR